jgi:2-succinyl-6-hydroxy-2,4-cyclohexadiene-1-carboxylate synthase
LIWALHGNLGAPGDWEAVGLGPIRAVDVYAAGGDFAGFARKLNRLARESGDPAPVLLGYSMGGRLGLHALLAAEAPWAGAVIVSAHTGLTDAQKRAERLALDREWARRLREDPPDKFWEDWDAQGVFAGAAKPAGPRSTDPRGFEDWSLGNQADLLPSLQRITIPVLWISGEWDGRYTAIGAAACGVLPHGHYLVVPGAGHRVPWEAPEAFRAAVSGIEKSGGGIGIPEDEAM